MGVVNQDLGRLSGIAGPALLALLVCVGTFKGNPAFGWVPIDLTALTAIVVAAVFVATRVNLGPATGRVAMPIGLWAMFLVPVAWTPMSGPPAVKSILLFTVTLALAVAPFQSLRYERQRRVFLFSMAGIAMATAIAALFVDPTYAKEYGNRLVLEGSSTIGTGRVAMAGAVIMALYAFQNNCKTPFRLALAAAALLLSVLGVMTGSRGPVLAAAVACSAVVICSPYYKRYRGRALVAAMIMAAFVGWLATRSQSDGLARILAGSETSDGARMQMVQESLASMMNHPFGAGWGSFPRIVSDYDYPHNLILEIGVEAGWFALIIIIALIALTTVRGAIASTSPSSSALYGLYIFSVINAMVSESVNGNRLFWVAMFALWVVPLPGRQRGSSQAAIVGREQPRLVAKTSAPDNDGSRLRLTPDTQSCREPETA